MASDSEESSQGLMQKMKRAKRLLVRRDINAAYFNKNIGRSKKKTMIDRALYLLGLSKSEPLPELSVYMIVFNPWFFIWINKRQTRFQQVLEFSSMLLAILIFTYIGFINDADSATQCILGYAAIYTLQIVMNIVALCIVFCHDNPENSWMLADTASFLVVAAVAMYILFNAILNGISMSTVIYQFSYSCLFNIGTSNFLTFARYYGIELLLYDRTTKNVMFHWEDFVQNRYFYPRPDDFKPLTVCGYKRENQPDIVRNPQNYDQGLHRTLV